MSNKKIVEGLASFFFEQNDNGSFCDDWVTVVKVHDDCISVIAEKYKDENGDELSLFIGLLNKNSDVFNDNRIIQKEEFISYDIFDLNNNTSNTKINIENRAEIIAETIGTRQIKNFRRKQGENK